MNIVLGVDVVEHVPCAENSGCGATELEYITDGTFVPEHQLWDNGSLWWHRTEDETNAVFVIELGKLFSITSFQAQLDCNDDYYFSYRCVSQELIGMCTRVTVCVGCFKRCTFRLDTLEID